MKFSIVQHAFVAIASLACATNSLVATAAPLQQTSAVADVDGILFNWNKAPWEDVIGWFAGEAGLVLEEVDQFPTGTFSFKSDRPLSPVEAIDELNHKLRLSEPSMTLLRNGGRLYLVSATRELPAELVETIKAEDLNSRGKYEPLQTIFDVSGLNFDEIQPQVRQRIQPHNEKFFQPYPDTKELFVRETGENLRFIRDVIARAKAAGTPTWADLTLKHISAELFLQQISNVFELDESYSNPEGTLKMTIDSTAGAQRIVIRGTPALIKDVEGAAGMFDKKPASAIVSPDDPPTLEQYAVPRDSKETFEVIDRLLFDAGGGARVIQGSETGKITVMGRKSDHELVRKYLGLVETGGGFRTIQLVNGDAGDILLATQTVLGITAENAGENVSMLADTDRDFIIVKGTPMQVTEAVQIIEELDRNAAPVTDGLRTRRRVLAMPPGDRDRILDSLEDYLPTLGRENLFDVRPPQETKGDEDSLFRRREREKGNKEGAFLIRSRMFELVALINPAAALQLSTTLLQEPDEPSPGDETNKRDTYVPPAQIKSVPGAPVRIWGTEFGIIVESDDLDAGDDVVYLIDSQLDEDLEEARPTVYQLKHCEAGYMKQLLESLYGLESSGGGGGGLLGGIADNVMGEAGGSMVDSLFGGGLGGGGSATATLEGDVGFGVDGRLNYLWVTGATMADLELIDESIKLFDVATPPQNPETAGQIFDIAVKHRDVEEMKTHVETLMAPFFKDAEATQGGGGGNDAANVMKMMRAMAGGGGGKGGGAAEEKKPRGYLSVDTKTSKLLFMGPKFIFVQVEALVFTLDQPEVVVPPRMKDFDLGGQDAGRVADLLRDLLGSDKVEISGDSSESAEGGTEGGGQGKANASGSGQEAKAQAEQQKAAEAARNNFIQMMRARAADGGGGGRGGATGRGGGGGGRGGTGGGGGRGGRGGGR